MRIIIISNRLPYSISDSENNYKLTKSIGGLATGLEACTHHLENANKDLQTVWVGWPGILPDAEEKAITQELNEHHCHPVYIPKKLVNLYYDGFCNNTLWPLFHNLPQYIRYKENQWKAYKKINNLFVETLNKIIQPDDILWVHDYHLTLLPQLLRESHQELKIGYFLHTPFPCFEMIEILPKNCRNEILSGILGADVIGFHTQEYTQNFIKNIVRNHDVNLRLGMIKIQNREIKVNCYPMGIDYNAIQQTVFSRTTEIAKLKEKSRLNQYKIILSVDRLDYTKGIMNRLVAFRLFLESNPGWHEKVILILIVAPSREGVKQYRLMKKEIDQYVGYINGKFGNINWSPILYQYKAEKMQELIELYSIADVALVTPLRDGMNLIAKEYLAAKVDYKGVLILSETAGASKELLEAKIVNPNDEKEIAKAIKQALELSDVEQLKLNKAMHDRLKLYDIVHWGNTFINDIINIRKVSLKELPYLINTENLLSLTGKLQQVQNCLIIISCDSILFKYDLQQIIVNQKIVNLINELGKDSSNKIILISGKKKSSFVGFFESINVIAEHGAVVKEDTIWKTTYHYPNHWKQMIEPLLKVTSDRLLGSFYEVNQHAINFYYHLADPQLGEKVVRELIDYLVSIYSNDNIKVTPKDKKIEIKPAHLDCKLALERMLLNSKHEMRIMIMDKETDDSIHEFLQEVTMSPMSLIVKKYANGKIS